jgi:hypothetical protein
VKRDIGLTIPEPVRREVFAMADRGERLEAMSQYMAGANVEKVLAIRLLAQAAHIGLGEAKRIIHMSPAWEFRRTSDDQFHEAAFHALKEFETSVHEADNRHSKTLKTGRR